MASVYCVIVVKLGSDWTSDTQLVLFLLTYLYAVYRVYGPLISAIQRIVAFVGMAADLLRALKIDSLTCCGTNCVLQIEWSVHSFDVKIGYTDWIRIRRRQSATAMLLLPRDATHSVCYHGKVPRTESWPLIISLSVFCCNRGAIRWHSRLRQAAVQNQVWRARFLLCRTPLLGTVFRTTFTKSLTLVFLSVA